MMIQTENLTKRFPCSAAQGRASAWTTAVDRVTLQVPRGEILALLGPNGAGKTTTVRMLGSILKPTEGRAWVAGYDTVRQAREVRQSVGLLTEFPGLYLRMLTPTAPKDPRMTAVTFPEGDLSFMHAIPPIGTKLHAAAAYGPESQLNLVNGRTGTYTGTLHFAFGPGSGQ
jgi:hypothetical protein